MEFSTAIPTFLLTLREGVEAALVVGITLSCLHKAKCTEHFPAVFFGIAAGIGCSIVTGSTLAWLLQSFHSPILQPLFEGAIAIAAIVMLTWMLIWMTHQARSLKGEVEDTVATLLAGRRTASWGLFTLSLLAVWREGFEVALFVVAQLSEGGLSVLGIVGGVAGAIAIGVGIFQLGLRMNLGVFFRVMGFSLLTIVAGLTVSALKEFDIAARHLVQFDRNYLWLCLGDPRLNSCLLGSLLWDTRAILPDKQFPGLLLKLLLGYRDRLYLVQAIVYLAFLSVSGWLYFHNLGSTQQPSADKSPEAQSI